MNSSEKTVTGNVSLTADISVTQNFIQNNHWSQPLKELEPLMYLLAYLPIKGPLLKIQTFLRLITHKLIL